MKEIPHCSDPGEKELGSLNFKVFLPWLREIRGIALEFRTLSESEIKTAKWYKKAFYFVMFV